MASQFERSDLHELLILAELTDLFWVTGDPRVAGEMRLQRQAFGLSPIDRKRLGWDLNASRAQAGMSASAARVAAQARRRARDAPDPRFLIFGRPERKGTPPPPDDPPEDPPA